MEVISLLWLLFLVYTGLCSNNPCQNGASCFEDPNGSQHCFCSHRHTGIHCEIMLEGMDVYSTKHSTGSSLLLEQPMCKETDGYQPLHISQQTSIWEWIGIFFTNQYLFQKGLLLFLWMGMMIYSSNLHSKTSQHLNWFSVECYCIWLEIPWS